MRAFLGIDPGKSGGVGMLDESGQILLSAKFPETERDIFDLFSRCREVAPNGDMFAIIEKVSASPQMGVTSAFTFGRGYGFLRGCLAGLLIPFEETSPQRWQKALSCLTKGDKNISKQRAQQLFPQQTWTHATADAVLIAEYNRRVRTGQMATVSV